MKKRRYKQHKGMRLITAAMVVVMLAGILASSTAFAVDYSSADYVQPSADSDALQPGIEYATIRASGISGILVYSTETYIVNGLTMQNEGLNNSNLGITNTGQPLSTPASTMPPTPPLATCWTAKLTAQRSTATPSWMERIHQRHVGLYV